VTAIDHATVRGITSATARCARQGAYKILGAHEDEEPVDVTVYHRRGHFFELLRAREYEETFGADNIERQRLVHWQAAGHTFAGATDIYVKPLKRIVEVVSAVGPTKEVYLRKIEQAAFYGVLDPEAESVHVDLLDPSKLAPAESIPVRITDDTRQEVERKIAAVAIAIESHGEDMPDRVCSHPREARHHLCPYASTCFAGHQEPEHVIDDDDTAVSVHLAFAMAERRKAAKAEYDHLDAAYRQATDRLAEHIPPGKTHVGPYTVTRSDVKGRETFRYSVAVAAGALDPAQVAAFVNIGEPHTRWKIEGDAA